MKIFFRIFMLTMAVLFASCTSNDNFLEDLSDNPYDNDTIAPVPGQGQLEADIGGSHFAAIEGGVQATMSISNLMNEQFVLLQIMGANQTNSVGLQIDGSNLYQGAVLNAADGDMARVFYMNISNPSDIFDSVDYSGNENDDMIITITQFNTTTNVASGTFAGTLFNPTTGESISVTNGVFTDVDFSNSTTSGMSFNGTMALTHDSTNFSFDNNNENGSSTSMFYFNTPNENFFIITGSFINSDASLFQNWTITFPYTASGTLNINGDTVNLAYAFDNANGDTGNYEMSPTGTITITQNTSNTISGTFEGSVQNDNGESVTITNGQFSFQY